MDLPFTYNQYVTGKYFIGRRKECSILQNLIKEKENIVLSSPPKTGKMSVIQQTIFNMDTNGKTFIIGHAKLFNITSVNDFAIKYISAILANFAQRPDDIRKTVETMLDETHFVFDSDRFGSCGEAVSLNWDADDNDLRAAFMLQEKISEQTGKQVILILQDFDQLLSLHETEYERILTTMREVLTEIRENGSQKSSIIMTGSHVNVMKYIFREKFYLRRLVEHLPLEEVDERDISENMVKGFLVTGKVIEKDEAIGAVKLFKNHLWYINHFSAICDALSKGYVSELVMADALKTIINIHQGSFIDKMNDLTSHQKSLLKATLDGVTKFSSNDIIEKYRLNSSANVRRVKDALMKKEIITFNDREEPEIIDPLFEYWLRNYYYSKQ